jgi:DNA-binding NarL/FixJ family response regulator
MEYRILVIDEDPLVRKRYADALINHPPPVGPSYSIAVVGSAAAAQVKAARVTYHLLLATLRHANEVLDLATTLHQRYPQMIMVLAVESGVSQARRRAATTLGAQLVDGPLSTDQVSAVVARALGLSRATPQEAVDMIAGRPPATLGDVQMLLDVLRRQASAQLAFFTDNLGNVIAQRGNAENLDIPALNSLIAGGFVNAVEMGHLLRDPETVHLSVHEGALFDVYSVSVGSNRLIALVFDRQIVVPRLGMVWLLMKRASQQLRQMQIVEQATEAGLSQQIGSSLNAEFDRLFGDELVQAA